MQRSLTRNNIWHMASLRISFLIRSVYDLLPSNSNPVRWGKKEDPTCPPCNGRQTTEHVLSSCKVARSQGRYTWRHNRVLQELAVAISMAKGQTPNRKQMQSYSPQREVLNHGTERRSSRQTRGNAYLTDVTTGKNQQIFQTGTVIPV